YANYVKIVREKSILRQIILSQSHTIERAFSAEDAEKLLNEAGDEIFKISEQGYRSKLTSVNEILGSVMDDIEKRKDPRYRFGIPTGFAGVQEITNGLQPSDLVILAARPSVGKTALGMNIITNIAQNLERKDEEGKVKRYRCAVFSLEMSKEQLVQRMLCSVGGVSMSKALQGKLEASDWTKIIAAQKKLAQCDIYIDDSSAIKPADIMNKCTKLKREKGLDIVLIDYLQLMQGDERRIENRTQEIANITRYIKMAAKELKLPIILLSQLSRDMSKEKRKPQLSDLRESGAIEQDADIVMFLHRDDAKTDGGADESKHELIFGKHRNGRLGSMPLKWTGEFVRFEDDITDPHTKRTVDRESGAPPAERARTVTGMSGDDVIFDDYGDAQKIEKAEEYEDNEEL
ncbi:MAG: replicative DNA helicase, partial [Clostridiales bacterium]|nr:replicative DNA helicase [Clostridiales bacterium]